MERGRDRSWDVRQRITVGHGIQATMTQVQTYGRETRTVTMGFQEIMHVLAYNTLAESLLDALGLTTGSGTNDNNANSSSSEGNGVPLFQELILLTVGNTTCGWMMVSIHRGSQSCKIR